MAVVKAGKDDNSLALVDSITNLPMGRVGGENWRGSIIRRVALAAVDTAGGVFAVANPWGVRMLVGRVWLDVTTASSGACTVDVGVAANGTTLSDILIDGVSVAAASIKNNILDVGTNGKAAQPITSTQYVTGSVASGASAGIVGFAFVEFIAP